MTDKILLPMKGPDDKFECLKKIMSSLQNSVCKSVVTPYQYHPGLGTPV